ELAGLKCAAQVADGIVNGAARGPAELRGDSLRAHVIGAIVVGARSLDADGRLRRKRVLHAVLRHAGKLRNRVIFVTRVEDLAGYHVVGIFQQLDVKLADVVDVDVG